MGYMDRDGVIFIDFKNEMLVDNDRFRSLVELLNSHEYYSTFVVSIKSTRILEKNIKFLE